jgi:hypothetical protein
MDIFLRERVCGITDILYKLHDGINQEETAELGVSGF